jgi:hypothetical protein
MMMPEQFTCHDLDLTARTNGLADETEDGWDRLMALTTEQLMASPIAGGRRINLRDNLNWIESRKDKHWMGFNETSAYLHTTITNFENYGIELFYDDHYCNYFKDKSSAWTLELSDAFRKELGERAVITLDGKRFMNTIQPKQMIEIPAGIGSHKIRLISSF